MRLQSEADRERDTKALDSGKMLQTKRVEVEQERDVHRDHDCHRACDTLQLYQFINLQFLHICERSARYEYYGARIEMCERIVTSSEQSQQLSE